MLLLPRHQFIIQRLQQFILKAGDFLRRQPSPIIAIQNIQTNSNIPDILYGTGARLIVTRLHLRTVITTAAAANMRIGGHGCGGEDLCGRGGGRGMLRAAAALDRQKDDRADQRVAEQEHANAEIGGEAGEEGFAARCGWGPAAATETLTRLALSAAPSLARRHTRIIVRCGGGRGSYWWI